MFSSVEDDDGSLRMAIELLNISVQTCVNAHANICVAMCTVVCMCVRACMRGRREKK